VLTGKLAPAARLEQALRPAQVTLQNAVQRGLQRGERKPENRGADQNEDRRPGRFVLRGSGQRLKAAQLGNNNKPKDQQVDEARQEPADQQRPPAAERSLDYPAHPRSAPPPRSSRRTR
jgi:hypothetical protein